MGANGLELEGNSLENELAQRWVEERTPDVR